MDYKVIRTADVWQKPTKRGHAGTLRKGDIVSVDWFWPVTNLGEIVKGNHLGNYVNRNDLEEIINVPIPPPNKEVVHTIDVFDDGRIAVDGGQPF